MANAHAIAASGLEAVPGDRCVSWLPLYHDMGLVGFMLTPLLCQLSVDFLATRDFARRPLVWLSLLSEHGGSLSYSPTFGYDLCARRADGGTHGFDLRRWRAAGIGGDMIEPRVPRRFAEVFAALWLPGERLRAELRHGRGDAGRELLAARAKASWSTPSTGALWPRTMWPCRQGPMPMPAARAASSSADRPCRAM